MLQGLPGGDSLVRVVDEELAEKLVAAGREIHRQDLSPVRRSLPLGEDGFVVRETGDTGPVLLGGSSQHPEYPRERESYISDRTR